MKSNRLFAPIFCLILLLTVAGDSFSETVVPRFAPRDRTEKTAATGPVRAPGAVSPEGRLNEYQKELLDRYLAGTTVVQDSLVLIAIQVQFSDSLMGGQEGSIREELRDSTWFANELKHVDQYFNGASRKNFTVRWEVTNKIYNLPKEMGYYGDDDLQDTRAIELMQSVIDSADADVNFALYETVMLIHAGAGQETDVLDDSREQLWSSFYARADINFAFPDSTVYGLATNDSLDGEPFSVDNFMLVPESSSQDGFTIGSLGVWVFEVGSRLGLLPLFDSEPDGGADSRGVGNFDVMSSGLFNGHVTPDLRIMPGFVPGFPSVFNRILAGWVEPLVVEEDGQYQLRDLNAPVDGDTACVRIQITESEYYLVTNRVHDENFDSLFTFSDFDTNFFPDNADSLGGAEFDFFLTILTDPFVLQEEPNFYKAIVPFVHTGTGMYVWHVDENVIRQMIQTGYLPNDFVSRKGVDLEEADGVQDLDGLGDPFSFGSHFDTYRVGNNTTFGPDTKPASFSNAGAVTGITITDISKTGPIMTCSISFASPFEDTRTRWTASGSYQPPSALDLDDSAGLEIVVFADKAGVYAFNRDGSEFVDGDGDPATIDPYIPAPNAVWIGPPAFGDIDGGGDEEIIGADGQGRVYAWKRDGSEVIDGDGDPQTDGVLFVGLPLAAPPMLMDINDDSIFEIVIIEHVSDSLRVNFVNGEGARNQPSGSGLALVWGGSVHAQTSSPPGYGALGHSVEDTEGVAFAWSDTVGGVYGFSYFPAKPRGDATSLTPVSVTWPSESPLPDVFPAASPVVLGDLDANGFDEAVFTLPDGRLAVFNRRGRVASEGESTDGLIELVELKSASPSAPALGDVDNNGTLEIALWDDDNFYLYEHNARLRTNWPQPLRPTQLGDFPDLYFDVILTSPMVGNIDGNDGVEILYPWADGAIHGFSPNGGRFAGFPRPVPDGIVATPMIADLAGTGEMSFVSLGLVNPIATIDGVYDSVLTIPTMALAIQTLPGSVMGGDWDWPAYQRDLKRQGRLAENSPPASASRIVEPGSFKIYPNPAKGSRIHARVVLNKTSTVRVEIYNLEGERVTDLTKTGNPANATNTPFDEVIDVARLKSGVYMLRMVIESGGGSESLVKNFAILR